MRMMRVATLAAAALVLLMAGCAGPSSGQQSGAAPAATSTTQAPVEEPTAAATAAPTEAPTEEASPTVEATAAPEATGTTEATAEAGGGEVPENALVSAVASGAPELDGVADDAAWQNAPAIEIKTAGGANKSDTTVKV